MPPLLWTCKQASYVTISSEIYTTTSKCNPYLQRDRFLANKNPTSLNLTANYNLISNIDRAIT